MSDYSIELGKNRWDLEYTDMKVIAKPNENMDAYIEDSCRRLSDLISKTEEKMILQQMPLDSLLAFKAGIDAELERRNK